MVRRIWLNGYFRVWLMSGVWLIPPVLLGLPRVTAGLVYMLVFLAGVIDNQGVWWRKSDGS